MPQISHAHMPTSSPRLLSHMPRPPAVTPCPVTWQSCSRAVLDLLQPPAPHDYLMHRTCLATVAQPPDGHFPPGTRVESPSAGREAGCQSLTAFLGRIRHGQCIFTVTSDVSKHPAALCCFPRTPGIGLVMVCDGVCLGSWKLELKLWRE